MKKVQSWDRTWFSGPGLIDRGFNQRVPPARPNRPTFDVVAVENLAISLWRVGQTAKYGRLPDVQSLVREVRLMRDGMWDVMADGF